MFKYKKASRLFICLTFLIFFGCDSTKVPHNKRGFTYSGIYFGKHLAPSYQQGIVDGCTTSKGKYRKSHRQFRINAGYRRGWFIGRKKCKNLLRINKNGDLIF